MIDAAGAEVNEAANAGLVGGCQELARAVDGGALELVIGADHLDAGGGVINNVAAFTGLAYGVGILERANGGLSAEGFGELSIAGGADQGADFIAGGTKLLDEMTPDKAGGAGDEGLHGDGLRGKRQNVKKSKRQDKRQVGAKAGGFGDLAAEMVEVGGTGVRAARF